MLLKSFARYIERKVIRVNHTSDKVQVAWHHVLEVVSDEDTSDIQLDVVRESAILVEGLIGLGNWDKEERLEGDFTLSNKVGLSQGPICVLSDALVELVVLPRADFTWLSGPDGLGLVDQLPVPSGLLDLMEKQ